MTQESYWRDKEGLAHLKLRRLDTLCPPLKGYLQPGMTVLDVGCGPGPITLDVAHEVYPGAVVGVDHEAMLVNKASELARGAQDADVVFQVGNAYDLDFRDKSFDLTYSLNLLPWLADPIAALQEQRRVTRAGGWVVASILDWGTAITYPSCPAFATFMGSLRHLADPMDVEHFVNFYPGHEAVALFMQARLTALRVSGFAAPTFCVYPDSEYFEDRYKQYCDHMQLDGAFGPRLRKLLNLCVLDEEILLKAREELQIWHAHPHAFHMVTAIYIAGRVA